VTRYILWIAALAACSSAKSSAPPPKEPKPVTPVSCEAPPSRDTAAYDARKKAVMGALNTGRAFTWEADPLTSSPDAARATCASTAEDVRFLCYEGLAQGYGTVVGKLHATGTAAKALRDHASVLGKIDNRTNAIHCRGLGAGLHAGGVPAADLTALAANVDPKCRAGLIDGYAARVIMANMKLSTMKVLPDATQLAALDVVAQCPGVDAAWCGFAGGRILGNMYSGTPTGVTGCNGAGRSACISGVAYVSTLLWDPDDLSRAVRAIEAQPTEDRAPYIAGFASALQWLRAFDAAQLDRRIACLPAPDRALVERVRATAEACGAFDFQDGTNCKWADVAR
jgi:hypothetical protein